MVYSINNEVVFGTAFTVPSDGTTPIILDILGGTVSMYDAMDEADKNRNRDASISNTCCQITRNTELGSHILSKWREYVIVKDRELGITGQGVVQLQQFYLIAVALLIGMLDEAATMIATMPTNEVITDEIKTKFINACRSADHIKVI